MHLVVLNVASPFAPVGPHANGNAEQIVAQLDSALMASSHESIVMACEGSITEGILLSTPRPPDETAHRQAYDQYRFILRKFLEKWPIDLIHMHGNDFHHYLPPPGLPVLVTLHQPPHSYPPEIFRIERPQTFLDTNHTAPAAREQVIEKYFSVYGKLVRDARELEGTDIVPASPAPPPERPRPLPPVYSLPCVSLSSAQAL